MEPSELPRCFANVSGFHHLDDVSLATYNWYPVNDAPPPLTDGQVLQRGGLSFDREAGVVTIDYLVEDRPAESIENLRARKIEAINSLYSAVMAPIAREFPEEERFGWPTQEAESKAYLKWVVEGQVGEPPATPMLNALLEGRNADGGNETLEHLAQRIETNVKTLIQTQVYTGHRHRLEQLAKNAASVEELDLIDPSVVFVVSTATG